MSDGGKNDFMATFGQALGIAMGGAGIALILAVVLALLF